MQQSLKIIETPRDAMQGIKSYIPASRKLQYINNILKAGFDTVEVGSFVSASAIPQMRDTADVINGLDYPDKCPKIMALIANRKGMDAAAEFEQVTDVSYPFSASPSFLQKNINKTPEEALADIDYFQNICQKKGKILNVYITMAFGNPYGDKWDPEYIPQLAGVLKKAGIKCIPLSDITGEADEQRINSVFSLLASGYPDIEFGLHLHAERAKALPLVDAAWKAGCRRFDTVLGGLGGCPMTGKELLANLDTLMLCEYLDGININHKTDISLLKKISKAALLNL